MSLKSGDMIDGRFQLEECVGSGGYGDVYRATQVSLERTVAVKLVHRHLADREDVLKRFRREALLTSKLDHPNAVRVLDFGHHEDSLYIAMEFVAGETLKEALSHGPFTPERVRRLGIQIAGALGAAHDIELMHRDLKPGNILLVGEGEHERAVVIDFGLVKAFFDDADATMITQADVMIGTPSYMSPETVSGKPQDGRADLFSLGVLLYEMLSGQRPYQGTTPLDAAMARLSQTPPPLPESVPHDLRTLIEGLLQKAPRDRPQTAQEVLDLLAERRPFAPAQAQEEAPTLLLERDGEAPTLLLERPPMPDAVEPDSEGMEADDTEADDTEADDTEPLATEADDTEADDTEPLASALGCDATVAPIRGPAPSSPLHPAQELTVADPAGPRPTPQPGQHLLPRDSPPSSPPAGSAFSWPAFIVAMGGIIGVLLALFLLPGAASAPPTETNAETSAELSPTLRGTDGPESQREGTAEHEPPPAETASPLTPRSDAEPPAPPVPTSDAPAASPQVAGSQGEATGTQPEAAQELAEENAEPPGDEAPEADEPAEADEATEADEAPEAAPSPTRARVERRTGTLSVNVDPYGDVYLNGERVGEAPVVRIEVAAGAYDVLTRYGDLSREERIRVRANAHTNVTHRFRR